MTYPVCGLFVMKNSSLIFDIQTLGASQAWVVLTVSAKGKIKIWMVILGLYGGPAESWLRVSSGMSIQKYAQSKRSAREETIRKQIQT